MASPCDSDTDAVPSPSSSGEYYIPGSRLIRYKSRRGGDFDPLAYHVADPATKTKTAKQTATELSERPVSAKGQAAGAETKQHKSCKTSRQVVAKYKCRATRNHDGCKEEKINARWISIIIFEFSGKPFLFRPE